MKVCLATAESVSRPHSLRGFAVAPHAAADHMVMHADGRWRRTKVEVQAAASVRFFNGVMRKAMVGWLGCAPSIAIPDAARMTQSSRALDHPNCHCPTMSPAGADGR